MRTACLHRKRINISSVLAGQRLGIKEVDKGIWLASFMHYDLEYFDLEQKTLQPLDNPVRHEVVTHVLGTTCHLYVPLHQEFVSPWLHCCRALRRGQIVHACWESGAPLAATLCAAR
jgi:hypothetical protein